MVQTHKCKIFQNITNERTINSVVNKTFEEVDSILKLIIIYKSSKQKEIEQIMQNSFWDF